MTASTPLRCLSDSELCLSHKWVLVPRWSLWSKWAWHICSARARAYLSLVSGKWPAVFSPPCPPCLGGKQGCTQSSWGEFRLPTALLIFPPDSQMGLSSLCHTPRLVCSICDLNCSLPRKDFYLCNFFFFSKYSPLVTGTDLITSLPFLSNSMWFSYSLGCIGVFLPVSNSFSVRTISHVDVYLMYSWEKMSKSSYSTIFISSLFIFRE